MMRSLAVLVGLGALVAGASAAADLKTVAGQATYALSEDDSRSTARSRCMDKARLVAMEEAGSVFESAMDVRQGDQGGSGSIRLQSHFAGVVASELVADRLDLNGDGQAESCEVRVTYDPDKVSAGLQQIANADQLRDEVARQKDEIAALKARLALPVAAPPLVMQAPAAPRYYLPPVGVVPVVVWARPVLYQMPPPYLLSARPVRVVQPVALFPIRRPPIVVIYVTQHR